MKRLNQSHLSKKVRKVINNDRSWLGEQDPFLVQVRMVQIKNIVFKILFWMLWPLVWLYAPLRTRSRVLVVCDNEFLAIRAYFGSGSWQLPGGGVGHNESSKSAAVRELKEEVSIVLNDVVTLVPTSTYKECGLLMRYDLFLSVLKTKPKIAKNKEIFDATWLPISSSQQHYPSHIQSALTAYSRGNLLK